VATAVRILFEILNEACNLIDGPSLGSAPAAPLGAIDGTEITLGIRPLVPDGNAIFLEVVDVGIPFEEPEQFVNDGAEVKLFGGEKGEALCEIKALLRPEDR
jgi:hypothetical protein